jgi:hypothetical protein
MRCSMSGDNHRPANEILRFLNFHSNSGLLLAGTREGYIKKDFNWLGLTVCLFGSVVKSMEMRSWYKRKRYIEPRII